MEYIVIALSVGGLNKKIYNSGDTVSDASFPPGNAEKLCKDGFLKIKTPDDVVGSPEEEAAWAELVQLGKQAMKEQGISAVDSLAKIKADMAAHAETHVEGTEENTETETPGVGEQLNNDLPPVIENPNPGNGAEAPELTEAKTEETTTPAATTEVETLPKKTIDEVGVKELRTFLTNNNIAYDKAALKEDLYALYVASKANL